MPVWTRFSGLLLFLLSLRQCCFRSLAFWLIDLVRALLSPVVPSWWARDGSAREWLTRWRRYIWLTRSAASEQEAFTVHASGSRLNGFRIGAACASVWLPARTDLARR